MNNKRLKIAVAVFGSRISPRFDCAPTMLIVEKAGSGLGQSRKVDTEGWPAGKRLKRLGQWQVGVLICGGIDEHSLRMISASNIRVYSWITGEYEDALSCFLSGRLASGNMMGPGGTFRGKWRFRRWRQETNRGGARCRIRTEKDQGGSRD